LIQGVKPTARGHVLRAVLFLATIFAVSFFTRSVEIPAVEGSETSGLRDDNFLAGMLAILYLPAFILSLLALYHTLRKDPSQWKVRFARYFAYALTLAMHLLAFHFGQWNAVFNPVAILLDRSGNLSIILMISSGMALFSLVATLPVLYSFLYRGNSSKRPIPIRMN